MKRRLGFVAVAISAVLGVLLVGAGTWLALTVGTDGTATTALGRVTSTPQARAIVIDVDRVTVAGAVPGLGVIELAATSPDGGSLAIATADSTAVEAQLDGVPYDAASFDGARWSVAPVPGSARELSWDSADWSQRSVGSAPHLPLADDSFVVIGHANADSGITADLALAWRIDWASRFLPWLLGLGVMLIAAAGVGGLLLARRR